MKIKGSLSAAQKFTPDIFPKPSKMWADMHESYYITVSISTKW